VALEPTQSLWFGKTFVDDSLHNGKDEMAVNEKSTTRSKIYALLGYCAELSGSSVPTFQDNLSVPSSRVKKSKKISWTS
jgi:hypothetical protein